MIDTRRMGKLFTRLAEIDSVSYHESEIAAVLETMFKDLGAQVIYDGCASHIFVRPHGHGGTGKRSTGQI